MSVESPSLFAQAIQEHLELKQQNSTLDSQMPLRGYKSEDPFENHPLFKTEEQARIEETMDGEPAVVASGPWPGEDSATVENANATHPDLEDSLWGRESRDCARRPWQARFRARANWCVGGALLTWVACAQCGQAALPAAC